MKWFGQNKNARASGPSGSYRDMKRRSHACVQTLRSHLSNCVSEEYLSLIENLASL